MSMRRDESYQDSKYFAGAQYVVPCADVILIPEVERYNEDDGSYKNEAENEDGSMLAIPKHNLAGIQDPPDQSALPSIEAYCKRQRLVEI